MTNLKVRITLTEEMLGMASANPEIHETYIASQAPDAPTRAEEIAALGVEKVVEKTTTIFPRDDDGTPILWDYQIKGFFKDAVSMLRRIEGTKCAKVKAFKKEIDGLLFINPRKIRITLPEGGSVTHCQRPLRAETPQGARVALANSETVPEGSTAEFEIVLYDDKMQSWVRECLNYGRMRGIGQWRNSGKGKFTWEELACITQPVDI